MFTWICPKCGTEVPPSHSECPTCALRERQQPAAQAPAPVAPAPAPAMTPPAPVAAPMPTYPNVPPAAPEPIPPPEMRRPPKPAGVLFGGEPDASPMAPPYANAPYVGPTPAAAGMPSWLVAILALLGVGLLSYGAYYFFTRDTASSSSAAAPTEAGNPVSQTTSRNPVAKFVEVTGFRIVEDKQKPQLKFLVVNHSSGEIGGFDLEVQVRTKNAKPEEPALFTVKAPIRSIGPWESKDFTVPASTTLRAYEMPDWQFLTATFDISEGATK